MSQDVTISEEEQPTPEELAFDYRRQGASYAEIGKTLDITEREAQELVTSYVQRILPDADHEVTRRLPPSGPKADRHDDQRYHASGLQRRRRRAEQGDNAHAGAPEDRRQGAGQGD